MPDHPSLAALRARIARLAARTAAPATEARLRLGIARIDAHLSGGLAADGLHEFAGSGPETEHAAAAALLIAGLLARTRGHVLWAMERRDLFSPALAAAGLAPGRIIFAEAPHAVLAVMEEGLRHGGATTGALAAVVGELEGRLGLTASRRLLLAAGAAGTPALVLRRSRRHDDPEHDAPSAALSRWRVAALPSPPPLPEAPDVPGLGRARWRLDLVRLRGGEPRSWIVEAPDAKGRLALPAEPADRPAAPAILPPRRAGAAGGRRA